MNLQLIKQDKFNDILVDVYRNDNDEVFMTSKQLGEALEYSSPIIAINKLVSRNERLQEERFSVVTTLVSTDGKQYQTRLFTEYGIYEVTMLSKQPKASAFRDFAQDMLVGLRKGEIKLQSVKPNDNLQAFEMQMIGAKHLADMLLMDDTSKIKMTYDVYTANGVPTASLPQYVDDEVTLSATELLKRNGKPMSAIKFNNAMIANGLLTIKQRPSSKGVGIKSFKSLTTEGLEYGKNLVSPRNNNETQPHYYESKFAQLLELLNN